MYRIKEKDTFEVLMKRSIGGIIKWLKIKWSLLLDRLVGLDLK